MRAKLTTLFIFFLSSTFAQKETGAVFLGYENENPKNIKLYNFSNFNKDSTCIIAFAQSKGKGFILGNGGKLIKQFSFDCPSNKAQVLGGVMVNDRISFLMGKSKLEDSLLLYSFLIKQDVVQPQTIASPIPSNKQLIGICQLQGKISFIGIDKEKPVLHIHQMLPDNSFLLSNYDFTSMVGKEYQKDKLYDKINELSSLLQIKMTIINDANTVPIQLLTCHKKLYLQDDSITLTIESKDKTDLFTINLATKQHSYKQVNYKCVDCNGHDPHYMSYNTFLFDKKIFSIVACSEALEINAIDINSNQIVNHFLVHEKDEIKFKNTPVWEEIDKKSLLIETVSEKEIVKTKKILKKMAYGWSIVTPRIDSLNRIELTIGGYLPDTNVGGGGFFAGGLIGGAIGGALLAVMMPVSMSGNDWSNTIHFKSLLDNTSLQHIEGQVSMNPEDYVNDYKDLKQLGDISEIVFQQSSKYLYAYIHPKTGMLTFVNLTE